MQYGNADFWQKKAYEEYKTKDNLQRELDSIRATVAMLENPQGNVLPIGKWIDVREKQPSDGALVVVKTKDGAKYFGSAYEGKLMSNVEYWYPLPQEK